MDTICRIIVLLISHLLLALIGYYCCKWQFNVTNVQQKKAFPSQQSNEARFNISATVSKVPYPNVQSPIYLLKLAQYETTIVRIFTNMEAHSAYVLPPELLGNISSYLYRYSQEILKAEKFSNVTPSTRLMAENPILAFNMIWRFAYELPGIYAKLQPFVSIIEYDEEREFIEDRTTVANWPSTWEVEESMTGLLRIQMVYDFDSKDLAAGRIYGVETGASLTIQKIVVLGQHSRESKQYTLAISWFELAIDKLRKEPENIRVPNLNRVQKMLEKAMKSHDEAWAEQDSYYFYEDKLLLNNGKVNPDRIPQRKMSFNTSQKLDESMNDVNYWSLCSGHNHQTDAEKAELSCWFDDFSSPLLVIRPIKVELLSNEPRILQMHELISEATAQELIQTTQSLMVRSEVAGKGEINYKSKYRTSVEGWIEEDLPKLDKLLEAITGLRVAPVTASQKFLVASYAPGGHYDCHVDAFPAGWNNLRGNRIATVMFYLNSPEEGGYTAFLQAGVAARPIKGSAVFWFNLKRNGQIDHTSYHCACPIVLGHKTISTKWIHENDQFLHYPCDLNPDN